SITVASVASSALRRRIVVPAPGQPIPHGRTYRYHLNGPVHMTTARKRVGPLHNHRLAVRHSVDYSSSYHFSSDDSSRDSSSSSSSESSSDSSVDALSDSTSSRSSSDHSLPTPSSSMRPSHQLCSLVPSIHRSSAAISERPSHDSSSTSPSRKRSRSPATSIDECFAYADDLKDREINARVVVKAIDREEIEMGVRGPVEVRVDRVTHPMVVEDILEPAQEGAVEVTYETLGDLVQRFHDHTEEIPVHHVQLEWDNKRLRDMMDVASQRVTRTMPNTRSGASRIREGINKQIDRQMVGALGARMEEMEMEEIEMEEMEMEEMEMEEMEMKEMEIEGMEMVMEEEMAITLEDLCLLESAHIKTS
ncbi:hypothetical protein Tco_0308369, partial [Tanacetum coccineum]